MALYQEGCYPQYALSLPIYGLLILQFVMGLSHGQEWRAVMSLSSIVLHSGLSVVILGRRFKNPLPAWREGTTISRSGSDGKKRKEGNLT